MAIIINQKGFTLIEVLISSILISIFSIPIFYISLQAINNYMLSELYYQANLNSQNILEQIKIQLDRDIDIFKFNSISKNNKYQSQAPKNLFEQLLSEEVQNDLELKTELYNYEVYIHQQDTSYSYYYPFLNPMSNTKPDFDLIYNDTNSIHDNLSIQINSNNINIDDLTAPVESPIYIDLDTRELKSDFNLTVRNYQSECIQINMYTNRDLNYNLISQSYENGGKIKVNLYNKMLNNQCDYIITVVVKTKDNKMLKQLSALYSFVLGSD